MDLQVGRDVCRRWESKSRYFEVRIEHDLFGQRILTAINGGLRSQLGHAKVIAVGRDIEAAVREIEKRRLAHKYVEVRPSKIGKSRRKRVTSCR